MTSYALLTYYTTNVADYQPIADINIPERDAYCKRHGYEHIVKKGPYGSLGAYYAVERLWYLLDEMACHGAHDVYWVLNLQSILTNHTKRFEEGVVDDTHSFFVTEGTKVLNAGSFVVKNDERGREWLRFMGDEGHRLGGPWYENQALINHANDERWKGVIKVVPQNLINAYRHGLYNWPASTPGEWKPGDLCLGLPGTNRDQRLALIKDMMKSGQIIR